MSGIAYIIRGANWASNNVGRVTFLEDVAVTGVSIVGSSILSDYSGVQYSINYTPSNTSQRGVIWSIASGAEYATINSNGLLTANSGVTDANVTIQATSLYDQSISATKSVRILIGQDIPEGALYYMPLLVNSTEVLQGLNVYKEDVTSYSAEGAAFTDSSSQGIVYSYTSADYFKAFAFDIKMNTSTNSQQYEYIFQTGAVTEGTGTSAQWGWELNLAYNKNTNKFLFTRQYTIRHSEDLEIATCSIKDGQWHRICMAIIDSTVKLYIDGVLAGTAQTFGTVDVEKTKYITIGNNWRFIANDGYRTHNGNIRKFAVYGESLTDAEAIEASTLSE